VAALPPGKEPPCTHWQVGMAGRMVGLDAVEKRKVPRLFQTSNPDRLTVHLMACHCLAAMYRVYCLWSLCNIPIDDSAISRQMNVV
jgi:hypothetical protein